MKSFKSQVFKFQVKPRVHHIDKKVTKIHSRITRDYWSSLRDTLAHGGQRLTSSSDKTITDYCSTLENTRLLSGDKYSTQLKHQYSQPSKLKAATSLQNIIWSKRSVDIHKGKQNINFRSKSVTLNNHKLSKKRKILEKMMTEYEAWTFVMMEIVIIIGIIFSIIDARRRRPENDKNLNQVNENNRGTGRNLRQKAGVMRMNLRQ